MTVLVRDVLTWTLMFAGCRVRNVSGVTMTSTNKMRCKSVIFHYGTEKQSLKACEELAELIRSISKLRFKRIEEEFKNGI